MDSVEKYDDLIIGGGIAGKLIAWTTSDAPRQTAIVERELSGGSCPNVACLRSENMIWSARVPVQVLAKLRVYGGTGSDRLRQCGRFLV
jgi:pyruvate/2-oxoglutarate dehydrogenase complex dihydrolipoamide dehydrogenase (E3) component